MSPHPSTGGHKTDDDFSPILLIATYEMETYVDGSEVAVCLTSVATFWPALYFVGSISVFFMVPFVILVVLYSVIAQHLMRNPGVLSYNHQHHGKQHRSNVVKYRKQVIFMLGAVVFSFFVCLLPFRAFSLWIIIVPPETILGLGVDGYYTILYFCRIMLYLNSAMNPILYNLMSTKFRNGFLRLLGCMSRNRSNRTTTGRQGTLTNSTNLSSTSCSSRRERFRKSTSRSTEDSFSFRDERDPLASISDEEQHIPKIKRQKNFDDIEEIEETYEEEPTCEATTALQSISQVCVATLYTQKTITTNYLQNNSHEAAEDSDAAHTQS